MPTTLSPVLTAQGLAALVAADDQGLDAKITHVALGDGGGDGYAPTRNQVALRNERARVPVGGGERVAPTEIVVSALLDVGPSFWVREVGFVVDGSKFLAIWSDVSPLLYYTAGQQLVLDYYLAIEGIPPGSVTIEITNPNVNIVMAEPFSKLSLAISRLIRRGLKSDVDRLTPAIQTLWR